MQAGPRCLSVVPPLLSAFACCNDGGALLDALSADKSVIKSDDINNIMDHGPPHPPPAPLRPFISP